MLKIGHRGAAGHEIENTAKSLQKALDLQVDMIEIDVHQCASGELVVFHDRRVKRITDVKGSIRKMTLEEIVQLRTIDGQAILTLDEALDLIGGRCLINIEIKSRGFVPALFEVINKHLEKEHWQVENFIISSFFHGELQKIKRLNENLKIGLLYYRNLRSIVKKAKKLSAYSVNLNKRYLKKKLIDNLRLNGVKTFIWTINTPEDLKIAKELEVDGVITDFPDLV